VAVIIFGVLAVTFMMIMSALESRHRRFIVDFAFGCALLSTYGFLSGAWPFGVVEAIWTGVAIRRHLTTATTPAGQRSTRWHLSETTSTNT
jgi:hypothetical protein